MLLGGENLEPRFTSSLLGDPCPIGVEGENRTDRKKIVTADALAASY